jgi:hypothetical protein
MCAYRLASVKLLCPNRSATSASGAPFIRKRLAHLCRKPCQRKFIVSASITASSNQCRPFSSGSSVLAGWNTRPLLSPRSCSTLRAATAASFDGTYGFFVLRPRDVYHLTLLVYHAPPQSVMTALAQPRIARHVELREVQRSFSPDYLSEFLPSFGEKPNTVISFAAMRHRTSGICGHLEGSTGGFPLIGFALGSSIKHECVRALLHHAPRYSLLNSAKRMEQCCLSFGVKLP